MGQETAIPGTCPICHLEVWQAEPDGVTVIIDYTPLGDAEVIAALKARQPLYRLRTWSTNFPPIVSATAPLWLAREIKRSGIVPRNLHGAHRHRAFEPDPPVWLKGEHDTTLQY